MKEKTADRYVTVQSVAETLGCSDDYVYMLIRDGSLLAIKLGVRAIRVSEQSLQAFISARVVDPNSYFAPEEPPDQKPKTAKTARSNWMSR